MTGVQTCALPIYIKITPAQETKIYAVNLKYAKKNDEARAIKDEAASKKALGANGKAKDAELKAIFTPDQYKTYQKMMEERRKEAGQKH